MTFTLASRIVDGNTEPLTVNVAKVHLLVSGNTHDAEIASLCTVAREQCEGFTNRALVAGPLTFTGNTFPFVGTVVLPMAVTNLHSIGIGYRDVDGEQQTYTDYRVINHADGFVEIEPNPGTVFPRTYRQRDAVTVTVESGVVPVAASLIAGMKWFVAYLFENRQPTSDETAAIQNIWQPFKVYGP